MIATDNYIKPNEVNEMAEMRERVVSLELSISEIEYTNRVLCLMIEDVLMTGKVHKAQLDYIKEINQETELENLLDD
jgi:pyrimidine operon attenuation protein/uracil phosphoribosyltransferase